MKGVHSNHVVQKILSKLPRERIDFIYDAVRGKVYTLSTQQYGCRVIQRMIELGSQEDKAFILEEFHQVAPKLVTDDWGNYVVQAVIKQGGDEARSEVIRLCIEHFRSFSKQKVASNVMEHCIEYGTQEDRLEIYHLIMNGREDGVPLLQVMWKDQFANYVVRKLNSSLSSPFWDRFPASSLTARQKNFASTCRVSSRRPSSGKADLATLQGRSPAAQMTSGRPLRTS